MTLLIEAARARDLITHNRLKMAKKVLSKGKKYQAQPFTPEEETHLVHAFPQQTLMYACLFLLLLRTGMRIGEALGLKIEDINLRKGLIKIVRTWTCGAEDIPKYSSARTIAIPPDLLLVLTEYMQSIRPDEAMRWLTATVWLFPGVSRLRPITLGWVRRHVWKPMLSEHGIPYRRIHDLRHTFATAILETGHSTRTLQKLSAWLGHSGPHVTLGIYAHLFEADHLDLVNDIGNRGNTDELRHCPTCQQPLPDSNAHI